jgi:hypothetical protein
MPNSLTPYLIRCTRHYYAGTIHEGRVQYYGVWGIDEAAPIVPFQDKASAKAAIEAYDSEVWTLGNGEYSRPTLVAVPVSSAPAHILEAVKYA